MSAAQSGNQRGGPGGAIDITTLSPHELLQLRKTVEEVSVTLAGTTHTYFTDFNTTRFAQQHYNA